MSCLDADRRTYYEARYAALTAQLTALDAAIDEGVFHVEMASLDTGEARQVMKYRSAEAMLKASELLESRISRIYHILNGTGLVNLNLRRKNRTYTRNSNNG